MKLHPHQVYHIYNRGNNRNQLFYDPENYPYFLDKMRKYITPHCDLLGYSLLPNHFHFLVHANEETILPFDRSMSHKESPQNDSRVKMSRFSHGVQLLLSSYAKAINKRHNRSGSLFAQNTHWKMTSSEAYQSDYSLQCFIYIHNNPVKAGLAQVPEEWPYSSYREYLGLSSSPLCNIELGKNLLSLEINELFKFDGMEIPDHIVSKIF